MSGKLLQVQVNDLNMLSEQTKEIITNQELIAINQSQYVYQARRLFDYGEPEVWGKPLISTMSGQIVVLLLNRTLESQTISFDLETVGINPAKCYTTKELWTKELSESLCDSSLSKQVAAHGVVVLKITGESIPYNIYQYKKK